MEDLHAAIAAFLRVRHPGTPPRRRRTDAPPAETRELAIYARVAGTTPAERVALSAQIVACRDAAGDTRIGLVFADTVDETGLERPKLTELRTAIRRGWITTVLVTSTARLTPDPRLLRVLADEWEAAGVAIVVVGGM
ncbi:MAG TPA: recombinase family protein [Thermomicrobiales bacterium]